MTLILNVSGVKAEALDIVSIELRQSDGGTLARFEPGAHLELEVDRPGAQPLVRHYSLCNDCSESDRYEVAVARAAGGRGGSAAIHDFVRVGTAIRVRALRNNFALEKTAGFYRFIAGGIGVTPILSMIRWCIRNNKPWSLLYCARSRSRAAFYDVLRNLNGAVRFHFDDESVGMVPDLGAELDDPVAGEHVYCCGPSSMMSAVRNLCTTRDEATVHFEWFSGAESDAGAAPSAEFEVLLQKSGKRLGIPADRSILDVLEANGMQVPNSCREGICGACETTVSSGVVDHRDHVLSPSERACNQSMMICVSRAKGAFLELDL